MCGENRTPLDVSLLISSWSYWNSCDWRPLVSTRTSEIGYRSQYSMIWSLICGARICFTFVKSTTKRRPEFMSAANTVIAVYPAWSPAPAGSTPSTMRQPGSYMPHRNSMSFAASNTSSGNVAPSPARSLFWYTRLNISRLIDSRCSCAADSGKCSPHSILPSVSSMMHGYVITLYAGSCFRKL